MALLSDPSFGMGGGLLGGAYIDPLQAGLSAATNAILPYMGATRLPTSAFAPLAAAGGAVQPAMMQARLQNLQLMPLLFRARAMQDAFGGAPQGAGTANAGATPQLPATPLTPPSGMSFGNGSDVQAANAASAAGNGAVPGVRPASYTGASAPSTGPGLPQFGGLSGSQLMSIMEMKALGVPDAVVASRFPGVTDFMRAYQDYANAPPQLKDLAAQRLTTAAGDRYQLMRNGWAFDKVTRQWMHMPSLGEGITGTLDPTTGQASAGLVPGYLPALSATQTTEAQAKARFTPVTVYDNFGNEYTMPAASLFGGGSGGFNTSPPARTPSTTMPGSNLAVGGAAAPIAAPAAPSAPASSSATASLANLKLADIIPDPSVIPQRPAPPPGAFYGAPNPGMANTQKEDSDRLASYNKEASAGQKIYQDLQQLQGTLQRGLNTNKVAPLWTDLTNIAQGLHATGAIPKSYDPNDAAVFDKVSTDLIFSALKQLPGQPRVAEIEGLRRANPGLTLPRAANIEILNSILANQQWQDARSRLGTAYSATYPGAPLGTFDAAFNAKVPLVDVTNEVMDAARKAGWRLPGDQNEGAGPSSGNPAQTPRITVGTTATGPNGAKIRWNGMQWQPLK